MRMIKAAEIGDVNGSAREKGWWKRRESLSRILEQRSSRMAVATNKRGTEARRLDDFVGTTLAVGKLSNGAGSSITVNLDFSHDKVAGGIRDRGSGLIGALAMKGVTFFGQQTKDLLGKLGSRSSETKKRMDIGSLLQSRCWGRAKAEVEGETKWATDSRDAANNIGPIDRAAVPSVSSSMGSLDKDSVGPTVVSGDGDSFIQEAMKVFHTDGLVIAPSSNMDADIQDGADRLKQAFEGTAIIDNNETAETNFQKSFLDQQSCKVMGGDAAGGIDEDEPSEVAHRVH
jgi:hypothetical protein